MDSMIQGTPDSGQDSPQIPPTLVNPAAPPQAPAQSPAAAISPANQPHGRLTSMLQGLFLGLDAFAKSAATGGREGGVQEVQQVQAQQAAQKLAQQRAQQELAESNARIQHTQATTNATIAQTQILQHNAPIEYQQKVLENQKAIYDLYINQLHIPASFAVPMIEGQGTDEHMQAINSKAGGDLVNNTAIPVHDEKFGSSGTSYGLPFDALKKTNLSIEQAGPALATLQNQVDLAKGILGPDDPQVKVTQGKLDLMKQGQNINGWDFYNFNQQTQAQLMSKVANKQAITEAQQKQAQATAEQQKADPLFKLENEPGEMAGEKASAAIPLLQNKLSDPATQPQDKVRASRLLAQAKSAHQNYLNDQASKAAAEQQSKQGDPNEAGKLLANGSLTLADMKTRGMTPKFMQQSIAAAQGINPGYKPADEVIAEQVAKSPQTNQFFGSANSLIQQGGTLDQLRDAAKNIPDFKLPIFNKVADYTSATSGGAGLPAYQATALGVADDYGKVMTGGQGSDASRMQAYNSIAASLNSGQREATIDAMRKAVGSQLESRIGNNQFMNRMYGYALPKNQPPSGATMKVPGSDGKMHWSDGKQDLGVAP